VAKQAAAAGKLTGNSSFPTASGKTVPRFDTTGRGGFMRRFLTLVCLLLLAIPAGVSFSGCTRDPGANYCNGHGFGTKITDVVSLDLAPATTGISIAYGQTRTMSAPSAKTCKDTSASVGTVTWGTTNNKLVDISPTGNICAGTWNRNNGGGIADYTICTPPDPLPLTGGLPYATAYVTASAQSVTSNPVEIFVHAQVTAVGLVTQALSGVSGQRCYSQGTQATLDAESCYAGDNTQYEFCAPPSVVASGNYACKGGLAPGVTSVPDCTTAIGALNYTVASPNIASVSTDTSTNQVTITAAQPGTTSITASVANLGSSAGYFTTCPPKNISVTLADGTKAGTITRGVTQNLVTTITDTNDKTITGLSLDYQSTDPIDISVGGGGSISTSYPGVASIYAICQPSSCNPAPIDQIGLFGTGLPITSNKVTITTPGTSSDYVWFGAPGKSKYIVPVELLTGTVGSTVRLPYVPNSMVMDRMGGNLFLGSAHELIQVSVATGNVQKEDTNTPGVVLAVSPNGSQVLINDQVRQVFYITGSTTASFGGMGAAAAWTPDSKTLYITDSASLGTGHSDTLYVYDGNTGWTTCTAGSPCAGNFSGAKSLALTIPSVGAFFSGSPTVSRTWCPIGTAGNYSSMSFYPQGDTVNAQTDLLAATTDGKHILGAALTGSGVTLSDIGVDVSPAVCSLSSPLSTGPAIEATLPVTVNAAVADTAINQLVTSPQSNLAFLTYTNSGTTTGATLPYYVPGSGQINYVTLTGSSAITAPLAGTFTPDDKLFFVSTAGDNKIHYINIPTSVSSSTPPTDSQQISPNLPACIPVTDAGCTLTTPTTDPVPATVIAVKPRSTT
jgi:sugar lactone lactonase YvrE